MRTVTHRSWYRRFVARTYLPRWVLKPRIQKHWGKPLPFHDKCPWFLYLHYTTHGTYSFTSHPKDEAIMVECLAQGHKRRDRPGRIWTHYSDNTRTWVQCTWPLGHDTPLIIDVIPEVYYIHVYRHRLLIVPVRLADWSYWVRVGVFWSLDTHIMLIALVRPGKNNYASRTIVFGGTQLCVQ